MRASAEAIGDIFRLAQVEGLVTEPHSAIIFYDLTEIDERLQLLLAAFPPSTLHAVAIKASPLASLLSQVVGLGAGLEAASLPELRLAENTGIAPNRIVFDSPAKTREELRYALDRGFHVNADSLCEIDRIASLLTDSGLAIRGTVGVRVNPQVGTGSILSTSVAGDYSKFGVPLRDDRVGLVERFLRHEWLTGLHVHIGSQGCPVEMLLNGIEQTLNVANEVDSKLMAMGISRRVTTFDLGGGLPVAYCATDTPISMNVYADAIKSRFHDLFAGRFRLITEFGRWVFANSGWVASRVEYVKRTNDTNTAIIHVGADLFLRKCYRPEDWHHDILVFGPDGTPKNGVDEKGYVIAGPLCFAGDVLGTDLRLPRIEEGDFIIIRDTGAYTLSMWSRYNSRQIPMVIGYRNSGGPFKILRARESLDDVAKFWR